MTGARRTSAPRSPKLATTPAGDAFTRQELEAMYHAAGFSDVTGTPVSTGPHTVVLGHKA